MFYTIMAISRQKEARSRDSALLLFRMTSRVFFIVHSTISSTIHSMPLNSLEHCLCTTTMTNIRPDRDSNLVPPGYKPQSMRMSHRGRPLQCYTSSVCELCKTHMYDAFNDVIICTYHLSAFLRLEQRVSHCYKR